MRILIHLTVLAGMAMPVLAQMPSDFLTAYTAQARHETRGVSGPSASRGQQLFLSTHGKEWICALCHTQTPTESDKHQVTGKRIEPLAPVADLEPFTSERKVEKWFKRNCGDVLGRACTAQEKADVLAYLLALK